MAEKASKRARRPSADQAMDEWEQTSSAAPTASSTRPRRGTTNQHPSAVIQRSSPEETRQSIHLTVKADPRKLKQATSGPLDKSTARTTVTSRNIVSGKRASRNSRVVREIDSDDDDEEDEDDPEPMDLDDDEEDEEDEDDDAEGEEDDEVDAEGEEDDDMEDIAPPPPPRVVASSKHKVPVNPVLSAKAQHLVEAKDMSMADDDDDEELSELDSDLEGDEEDAEGEDDDAEGEDDDQDGLLRQNGDEDEDDDMDSDDGTPGSEMLDLTKLTKRQRARGEEDSGLMSLSNEAQKKKHLTAEEHAMRRAEMARRRKNLSEKRNEEEKMDTINRLLKKQPPKRGKRVIQDANESGQEDEGEVEKANPLYVRYTQTIEGALMGVPEEWLESPAGNVFALPLSKPTHRPYGRRMVEEVS